jgi:hypothetical protein
MQLATSRIKNDNLRTATIGYLNLGEFVVDKGL